MISPGGNAITLAYRHPEKPGLSWLSGTASALAGHGWHHHLRLLAGAALGLLIVTLPWRQRLLWLSRPRPPIYADFSDLLLFTHDLLLIALLFTWGGARLLRPRPLRTGPFFIWAPLSGMVIFSWLSVIASADPLLSAYHALHRLLLFLLYLYLVNVSRPLRSFGWAFAVLLLVQAPVSLLQAYRQQGLGLGWLGERDLSITSSATVWAQGGLTSLRAYGLSDHPNILAINLILSILLLAGMLPSSSPGRRTTLAIVLGLGAVSLLLTFSTLAWSAFAAAGFLMCGLLGTWRLSPAWRHYVRPAGLIALLLAPVLCFYLPYLTFGSGEAEITARLEERLAARSERLALNGEANRLFVEHALIGVGVGALPIAVRNENADFDYDFRPAPAALLDAAAETGLFGAMFYLFLLISPWIAITVNRRRLVWTPALAAVTTALLALTLFSLSDGYSWAYSSGRLWQWMLWGLWGVAYEGSRRESEAIHA
jgi:hypothetical protein